MSKTVLKLFNLVRLLESKTGKRYSNTDLLPWLGVSRPTASRYMNGKTDNISLDALTGMIRFFRSEGMPVTYCDLLEYIEDETDNEPPNPKHPTTNH